MWSARKATAREGEHREGMERRRVEAAEAEKRAQETMALAAIVRQKAREDHAAEQGRHAAGHGGGAAAEALGAAEEVVRRAEAEKPRVRPGVQGGVQLKAQAARPSPAELDEKWDETATR